MKSRLFTYTIAMTLLSALAAPLLAAGQSNALQGFSYKVLYTFTGDTDGAQPYLVNLVRDDAGNLYGTTEGGGYMGGDCADGTGGCGVVFKVDPMGHQSVLYSFMFGTDGGFPLAGVILDSSGNLYGTASGGGDPTADGGVVFKVNQQGQEIPIYSFTYNGMNSDGAYPGGSLTRDGAGNLYGTTEGGGTFNAGTVFEVDTMGSETILYSFTGQADGGNPSASLVRDENGNLYGTTFFGGSSNVGVVFKLDTAGHETPLYTFTGGTDGGYPNNDLVRDDAGNLYGTTSQGGVSGCGQGCGVVFEVGPTGNETVLYSFTGGADGRTPYAGVVRDEHGNLYGTTFFGGDLNVCGGVGCGTVYKLDRNGRETVLYTFTGQADGGNPYGGVLRDGQGNLYGTTGYGGNLRSQNPWCGGIGCGVVFKISACHTALCHGEDDAETVTAATTNLATATQHLSTAAPATAALGDRPNLDQLRAQRFPSTRSLGATTAPTN